MRVKITNEAKADLEAIGDFIAADNPTRAVSFLKELVSVCEKLSHSPQASPLVAGFEQVGLRFRPYRNYIILYRIAGETIEVVHLVHGARDYRAMLTNSE